MSTGLHALRDLARRLGAAVAYDGARAPTGPVEVSQSDRATSRTMVTACTSPGLRLGSERDPHRPVTHPSKSHSFSDGGHL